MLTGRRQSYVVTLSLPPDTATAAKIIRTPARSKNKTTDEVIAEFRAASLTIAFSDKKLLERNLPVPADAGFNPKVTIRKR